MKVLYVSKALTVGAYRDKLRQLARHVDISAIIPDRWGAAAVAPVSADGPVIHRLPAWFHGHNHLHVYRGIESHVRASRPQLVHIDEEPYSAATAQLIRICGKYRVPTLFFAWQNLDKQLPPPFGALRSYVFRQSGGAIAGTARAGEVLRTAGYQGPLAVVPQFGVDPERFRPNSSVRAALRHRLGLPADSVVIGFGGRLVPEKGVHLLVDALVHLPSARLVVMGAGPEQARLIDRARRQGVYARTHFVGAVESTAISDWLPALDVLALPSLSTPTWVEQFGRILVEAMACGVAVVGARSGEIPNVVGDAGVTVAENDVAALTDALRCLCGDPGRRAQLGARGRQRVFERFTQEHIAQQTVQFYQQVAAR